MEENKKTLQSGEADNWIKRNLKKVESGEKDEVIETLTGWLIPFKDQIKSLAEIGCGSGHKLSQLSKNLDAEGFGVDPSNLAIAYAKRNFPQLKVSTGFGDSIPFDSQFDLVHLGFFLYLTDRDLFLKTVSEADRITARGGFLSILDFETPSPYSNNYSHNSNMVTHKLNSSNVFVASGLYTVVNKISLSHEGLFFNPKIDERITLTLLYKETEIFLS